MALTKRSGKGSALTNAELDANFTHLGGDGTFPVPSTKGTAGQVLKMNAGATALEFATDATGSGGIASVVADTTPQLGGDLDINANSIVSTSNANIAITPNGSGKVVLDGLSHPTADGTSGQAITTDGSGNLTFSSLASSLAIQDEGSALSSAPAILNFVGNGVTVTGNGNSTKTITISGGGGAGSTVYNNASSLPLSGNSDGDMAFAKDTNRLYVWNGVGWYSIALVNASPTISSGATSLNLATDGTATVVTITATDPEGAPLTYAYSVTSGSLTNGGGATATVVQGTGANVNKFTITPTTTQAYAGNFTLTFTASDGVSTATSPATYTLVFSLPQHRSTAIKVKTSGNNGRTNSVFDDASTTNHAITSNGASYQSTVTPYTPLGQWSTYFGGDDIVHFTHASDFNFGNGDFCCEAWVKQEAVNQGAYGESVIFTTSQGADSQGISLHLAGGTTLFILAGAGSWVMNTGAIAGAVLEIGKWHHIAFTRHSNNIYLYFDGRQVHTQSFTTTLTNTNNKFAIGGRNAPAAHYFRGWISNVRVVKGSSVYTGADGIKPPTDALTAVSGTVLLTCNGNRFEDFSGGNAKTVAFVSEPIISDLSPVKIADIWKTSLGGSVYFDGIVGTYLSLPDSSEFDLAASASGGDFTLECWAYADGAQGSYDCIMSFAQDGVAGGYNLITGGNPAKFHYNIGGGVDSTTNFVKNTWVHLALVRSGSAAANVKLYINGVADATTKSNTGAHAANNQPRIGQYPNMTIRMFKGYIADVRLVNGTAVYTSNFTPPTAPLPIVSNTKLKLNFDQAGVFDSVSNSRLQLYGDAKESTTQTKYATTSVVFDGTGDYIKHTGAILPTLSGSEWQLEFWVYPASGDTDAYFISQGTAANAGRFCVGIESGTWSVFIGTPNTQIGGSLTPTYNQWQHVVVIHTKTHFKWFLDGVEKGSVAHTTAIQDSDFFIGDLGWAVGSYAMTGYIEDIKILNDHTTYPNERPQEALTAVSGTALQFANASTIPSSPNGLTVTASEGTPTVSPFTPPDSTVSHSIYYDGSDMHTVSANTNIHLGTGDFTIEGYFWIVAQVGTYDALFGTRAANDTNGFGMSYTASNMYVYSAAYLVNNIPFEYKKWMHLAYQRKTIGGTATHQMFRDGVLVGSGTTARTFANNPLFIGGDLAGGENSNVYISDFRVVKGTAVYDTSFTPPGQAL